MENKRTYEVIGNNIKYIREQKQMTTSEFAEYIKTTKPQLSNVENGERGFSITKLSEIAEITNYPLSFILTGRKATIEKEFTDRLVLAEEHMRKAGDIINSMISLLQK